MFSCRSERWDVPDTRWGAGRNRVLDGHILHTRHYRTTMRGAGSRGCKQSLGNFSISVLHPLKVEALNIHWYMWVWFSFFKASKLNKTNFMLWYHTGYRERGCSGCTALSSTTSANTAAERSNRLLHPGPRTRWGRDTPCQWLPQTICWWAKGRVCGESWVLLLTRETVYSSSDSSEYNCSFRAPSKRIMRPQGELWRKQTIGALINLLFPRIFHSLKIEVCLMWEQIL